MVENVPDQPSNHFWFGEVSETLVFLFFSKRDRNNFEKGKDAPAEVLYVSRGAWEAGAEPTDFSSIIIPGPRVMNHYNTWSQRNEPL